MLCGISKGTFEIPRKISYPYTERRNSYSALQMSELSDLLPRKSFLNAPWFT